MSVSYQQEKLDSASFDDFIAKSNPFNKGTREINLKGIKFVSSSALVQLVAVCYALKNQGRQLTIILDDQSVGTYLVRAGFVTVLKSIVNFIPQNIEEMSFDHLRGANPSLIEVTKIEKGADLPALLNQIVSVLREKFKYKKYEAFLMAMEEQQGH